MVLGLSSSPALLPFVVYIVEGRATGCALTADSAIVAEKIAITRKLI